MKQISKLTALFITMLSLMLSACSSNEEESPVANKDNDKKHINAMLDSFNAAAAKADYNAYFNFYTGDAVFAGTDATERWDKKEFMAWAKPFFDRGSAWNFTSLQRNIYFDKTANLAWFDELLNTQMKICRGSGVLVKQGDDWKVQQYILSATIPNELLDSVIKIKDAAETGLIKKLSTN